jgi:multiple sugar transport system permease protein
LQTLDPALHDAARVDGASWWQDILYVTIPHVRDLIITLALFDFVTLAASFDLIWIATNGGPVRSTEVIATYIYRDGFLSMHWNRAGASGMILIVMLTLFALFMMKQMRDEQV